MYYQKGKFNSSVHVSAKATFRLKSLELKKFNSSVHVSAKATFRLKSLELLERSNSEF